MEIADKRKMLLSVIEGLEILRDDARSALKSLQESEACDPNMDVDDLFDDVVDILGCVDQELKAELY